MSNQSRIEKYQQLSNRLKEAGKIKIVSSGQFPDKKAKPQKLTLSLADQEALIKALEGSKKD